MVWEPKQCCCGASVRVGTLILGWFAVIGNALHVLSLLKFTAVRREDMVELCRNISSDPDMIHFDDKVCDQVGNIGLRCQVKDGQEPQNDSGTESFRTCSKARKGKGQDRCHGHVLLNKA